MAELKITVKEVPPYDGEYVFDLDMFTNGELRRIKQISGVVAGKITQALRDGDNDVVVALTVVAVERARPGVAVNEQAFWDAVTDAIKVDNVEAPEAQDDRPLEPSPTTSGSSSESAATD